MNTTDYNGNTQFIMIETDALYQLIKTVMTTVKKEMKKKPEDWIDEVEAKEILGVSSKSTMQRFRDEDRICYAMVTNKNIKYSRKSILQYLETKSNKQYV